MPSVPYTQQRRVARFRDQRWLLDAVIKQIGVEFDQSRLQYLSAPLSPDHRGAVLGLQSQVKRWDDTSGCWRALAPGRLQVVCPVRTTSRRRYPSSAFAIFMPTSG